MVSLEQGAGARVVVQASAGNLIPRSEWKGPRVKLLFVKKNDEGLSVTDLACILCVRIPVIPGRFSSLRRRWSGAFSVCVCVCVYGVGGGNNNWYRLC